MLDAGLVLYLGLVVLFVWRFLSGWRLCGAWMEYANYCMLLYMLLLVLNAWAIYSFISLALRPEGSQVWEPLPRWLRPMVLGTPAAAVFTYILAFIQTCQHVNEIRRGAGTLKHDRAVQIIALPAVFGCMAMNALTKVFQSAARYNIEDPQRSAAPSLLLRGFRGPEGPSGGPGSNSTNTEQFYMAQVETCYQVGDLYEAWALYQFCKMTLEILKNSLEHVAKEKSDSERKTVASGLLVAHKSLADIAYTGVSMFLVVCCAEAGWSLYLLTFTNPEENWADYNSQMGKFQAAGLVASMAAIYNLSTVEMEFHTYFQDYGPLLKFMTVKLLLSLAYFQKGCVYVLQTVNRSLPGLLQSIIGKVPFVKELVSMGETEFYLFYSSVILYECVLGVFLHYFAWPSDESFYGLDEETCEGTEAEKKPLLDKAAASA
ncbi:unnamed protein product [Effrenium voratum]|uniref:Uncharacterized protein n=1 Tax=Effrenium voratum TaxID=2562239 RepID=A0AA36HME2_9DINO|nr:unnamed protein product [Effrenium voratum]CAJ1456515.1 unnamed protein product [Effrenium voratum]